MSTCPRCGEDVAEGQEYCLECGHRLPAAGPLQAVEASRAAWSRRALLTLVVAVAAGGGAIAAAGLSDDETGAQRLVIATGGFATTQATRPQPAAGTRSGTLEWPPGRDGWTIALATLPQTGGKARALERVRDARRHGLSAVGLIDSSRYASLHPGYWLVFSGVYSSEAEATSALERAHRFARTATVRRIVQ